METDSHRSENQLTFSFSSWASLQCNLHLKSTDQQVEWSLLRQPPPYAEEIWKRSFNWLGLPSTLDPSRKGNISKTLFKPEEFENVGFSFSCGLKTQLSKTMMSR